MQLISNAAAQHNHQMWDSQRKNTTKAKQGAANRHIDEIGMPVDGGLDGGLNMGSIVGPDGIHPLSMDRNARGHGGVKNSVVGYDEMLGQHGQQQTMGVTSLQPIRMSNASNNRAGGQSSPRGQQLGFPAGGHPQSLHQVQAQQLHLQQQQQLLHQQQQMQSQNESQMQQARGIVTDTKRSNRSTRNTNGVRGRRQKNGNSSEVQQSQMSGINQNVNGGGTSLMQTMSQDGNNGPGMGSMFHVQGNVPSQGSQSNRGSNSTEIGLPQLVNSMGHAQRRQASQAQQPQPLQQQQPVQQQSSQQMTQQVFANQSVAGVPRESLPSYVEEHQFSSTTSIKGLKPGNPNWINQDNFFIIERFDNRDINFYCVLDGHGENGHHVSRHCRNAFPQHIRASNLDMKRAFNLMQNDLNSCEFDVRCSGATCVLAALCGARLSVSNCGDSRAVLGRRNPNGSVTAHALTQDHKPDKPEERKRILACGGHLGCRQVVVNQPGRGPISMPVGPCRVWYQNRGETLGLAMSRSLGDSIVHRSGVSAEPETLEHIVDEFDEFMIIATDGVWDVIDNNQAVQMVQNFSAKSPKWNALDASNTICKFARSRWEKLSPMVDDITCIVVKLQRR